MDVQPLRVLSQAGIYNPTFVSFSKFHFLRLGMFILLAFLASEMTFSCESSQTDSNSGCIFNSSCLG